MKRRTPMKRTYWPRREYVDPPTPAPVPGRLARMAAVNEDSFTGSVQKERPIQHEGYMRLVRQLPCAHCGIEGYTQFCHADEGKGMGIKTDCRRGWPGCGPHGDSPGCHYLIGSTGTYTREDRRALEERYGEQTRARIMERGEWPMRLPLWG